MLLWIKSSFDLDLWNFKVVVWSHLVRRQPWGLSKESSCIHVYVEKNWFEKGMKLKLQWKLSLEVVTSQVRCLQYVQIHCRSLRGKHKKKQPTASIRTDVLAGCCLIAVDLLSTERRPHSAESLKEVCVFNGWSLHALLLKGQQSSLKNTKFLNRYVCMYIYIYK